MQPHHQQLLMPFPLKKWILSFFIPKKFKSVNQNLILVSSNPRFNKPVEKNRFPQRMILNPLSAAAYLPTTVHESSKTPTGVAVHDKYLPDLIKTDAFSLTKNNVHLRTKVTDIEHFFSVKSLIFNPNNLFY